ncbi:Peptidoglycan-associated lipoprotein [Usitatibacter rugosus]|uniref:Peptidoglycan-associated lipoprotein n=1 Tax=Usitatibacter rugosus TaxID=2732067 RepID=A0A6M4GT72_9PROT|nr:peptidoglycan-associated lipoprotein Pal [Usitatibacter rugosus]QJR10306.1 Peptidoglycan-associated lipoprotein [Usitatibacter rugosus]
MQKAVLYIAVATVLAACGSTETKQDVPVRDTASTTTQPSANTAGNTSSMTNPRVAGNPLTDPSNILSKRSVFFDYDSNAVKDEFRPVVQAHSKYMTADKRDSKIRIEGNCDERGSREYNLALGQRRAEAVKKVMTVLGVQDGRIETVSFGEEKPQSQGHDEGAYAQNRRADIKYSGE